MQTTERGVALRGIGKQLPGDGTMDVKHLETIMTTKITRRLVAAMGALAA